MPAATHQEKIAGLYVAFFNRAPDAEGLAYWTAQFGQGASVRDLASGFAGHPVFDQIYSGLDARQFVEAVYQNVLGAPGDTAGITYWLDLLSAGLDRYQMVADFVDSALTVDLDAMHTAGDITAAEYVIAQQRQTTIHHKAEVGLHFAQTFGEWSNLADTTDDRDYASLRADPAFLLSQSAIAGITDDPASTQLAMQLTDSAAAMLNQADNLQGNLVPLIQAIPGAPDTTRPSGEPGSVDVYLFSAASFDAGDQVILPRLEFLDRLYVGNYQLNEGDLSASGVREASDDRVLELFLTQQGADVRISLETDLAAAKADEPAMIEIVLTGTTVAAVEFADGLIGTS